jgi:two-component system OmpR family response regulator
MRILIIEDDREAASYLAKAFREAGHVADHAADGLDGYAMAEAGDYDVLVVDRMLPKLDGLSLIRSLREQNVETPVLILSALGQVDDRVKGLRAGGDDYLPKPYAFSELLAPAAAPRRRPASPRPTASRISNSTGCRIASPAPAPRSRSSRASTGSSNT